MRKLLELLAEPALAQRDAKLRDELRNIVGSNSKKQQSVLLMDGNRTQKQIIAETSVHQGHLSTMVGRLENAGLLADGKKQPKLSISIPVSFFDATPERKR
jgi:DNA-binding MarR family transcriptional regulator